MVDLDFLLSKFSDLKVNRLSELRGSHFPLTIPLNDSRSISFHSLGTRRSLLSSSSRCISNHINCTCHVLEVLLQTHCTSGAPLMRAEPELSFTRRRRSASLERKTTNTKVRFERERGWKDEYEIASNNKTTWQQGFGKVWGRVHVCIMNPSAP